MFPRILSCTLALLPLMTLSTFVGLASAQKPLRGGTFLGSMSDSVKGRFEVIDPFAGTSVSLSVIGSPLQANEVPKPITIESPVSWIFGSMCSTGWPNYTMKFGNIYRVQLGSKGWMATKLNSNKLTGEGVIGLCILGSSIYFTTIRSWGQSGGTCKIWKMPIKGGTARLYYDLNKKAGASGAGARILALGSTLHLFTYVTIKSTSSTTGPWAEHWVLDTSKSTLQAKKLGNLPTVRRKGAVGQNFGPRQVVYDRRSHVFILGSAFGDVLWRTASGKDVRQRSVPTTYSSRNASSAFGALALNTDTGALGIGDTMRHFEELRCPDGPFLLDKITASLSSNYWFMNLAYIPLNSTYLPVLPNGWSCAQSNKLPPCSYSNSLPRPGNQGFAFTVMTPSNLTFLLLGTRPTQIPLASLGATGCFLRTLPLVFLPGVNIPGKKGELQVKISLPPTFAGPIYTQWLVRDASANKLGWVMSDARQL